MTRCMQRTGMKRGWRASLLVVGAGLALAAQPVLCGEDPPVSPERARTGAKAAPSSAVQRAAVLAPAAVPAGAAGMTIYIDPNTGAILTQPAPGTEALRLSPELQNALSTSHEGLREVPNTGPGGGFKLDLQGRFQSPLVATTDANGKVTMRHLDDAPKPAFKK